MKKCFFTLLASAILLQFVFSLEVTAKNHSPKERGYFDKHIIIVAQQNNLANKGDKRRDAIYNVLSCILTNKKIEKEGNEYIDFVNSDLPHGFSFNPSTDKVSLFSFGYNPNKNEKDTVAAWNDFIKNHFTFQSSYPEATPDSKSFSSFIENDLDTLLKHHEAGLALAYYTDPLILTQPKVKTLTKEYFLIILSPFFAGKALTSADYDVRRVNDYCFSGKLKEQYRLLKDQLGKQDELFDIATLSSNPNSLGATNYNSIKLRGHKIVLRALNDINVICKSTIDLKQKTYGSNKYYFPSQKINFTNNENIRVDSVTLFISEKKKDGKEYIFRNLTHEYNTKDSYLSVSVPGDIIELDKQKVGDVLSFEYVLFITLLNESDKSALLPYVYEVPEVEFTFTSAVFPLAPTTTYLIISAILLTLLAIAFGVWHYRGRFAKGSVDVEIGHISKQRYMNITSNKDDGIHVTNAPCWYIRPGTNEQRIHVTCSFRRSPLKFAKKYRIKLSYMVKDLDENYDFTFRPEGQESDGSLRKVNTWYEIPNSPTYNNQEDFEFNAIAYVGHGIQPDLQGRENILKLGVCFKAELVNNAGIVLKILDERNDVPYVFIAKEYFPNRELWMAFDPGTSGSCVAYGYGGRVVSKDNIHLARNFERTTDGSQAWVPIFPSKIRINDNSHLFEDPHNVENAKIIKEGGEGDFWFGNDARQLWGRNSFQSIKKLLGYSNELPITRNGSKPASQKIAGRDLAHLLIKGIINRFEMYLTEYSGGDNGTNDKKALEEVRPKFLSETGIFQPSRAIVTVPNNFTLVKILDMVESIRRTKKFKEVHFLYEAEGVIMYYLRENWSNLNHKEEKNVIVFDMGGATINASAFSFRVTMGKNENNIEDVTVKTVSRIGYGIGGDDIDFALIQILCSIPSVSKCIDDKNMFIKKHKTSLLKYVEKFKLSYIDKKNEMVTSGNIVTDMATLWGSLKTNFKEWDKTLILPDDYTEEDENYLKKEHQQHKTMRKYVLSNVEDAIAELVNSPNIKNKNIEIVFSGRSTLYPGIKESVMERLNKAGFKVERWKGFDKKDIKHAIILDDEKVKSAVVIGACWYAMWSQFITIRHDIVTSTFGFIDMKDKKEVFHPVVNQGETLENGHRKHEVSVFDPRNPNISFIQMLGTNYDEIWKKKIYHKMNQIIQLTDIEGDVDSILIDVDDKNNFRYLIKEKNGVSHGGQDMIKDIDILDENSEAYIYAAYTSEETEITQDFTSTNNSTKDPTITTSTEDTHKSINKRGGGL